MKSATSCGALCNTGHVEFWFPIVINPNQHLLDFFHVTPKLPIAWHPRKVVCEKPPVDWMKMNIDRSCRGNLGSCGGGGIIYDNRENLSVALLEKNWECY